MTWICIACGDEVGKDIKLAGVIPTFRRSTNGDAEGSMILCDECYDKWSPRDR